MKIYDLSTKLTLNRELIKAPNLTDRFTSEELTCIGEHAWTGYTRDQASRADWLRRQETAMNLAMQIQKEKNFPWPGASNVIFPLVTIAALQFSSRSYSNIVQGLNVVKYRTPEGAGPELLDRAKRIGNHMSWQVLEEDTAWEDQHDKLLINLGIVGTNFIKTYFKPSLGHNVSELVMARDLVVDYWAKSIRECARKTHVIPLYRNDIYERVQQGLFRDVLSDDWFKQPAAPTTQVVSNSQVNNRAGIHPPQPDEDTPFRTLEQHRWLDLDKDGYNEPYIVTFEETSKKVLRITSRIEREEDIERNTNGRIIRIKAEEYLTKFGFIPAPDGSIYDIGFGTLLGPLNEGVNTAVNQIFDVGTMVASNGGFLGRGAKIRGGSYTFAPWEWKRVDSTGDDLRKSLVQLPVREPSTVMFQMLGLLINYVDRLAGTVDTMVGENPGQNTKTGVANQTLEQGMQVYSSIFKRTWRSTKEEFACLYQLNRRFLPDRAPFGDKGQYVLREDYNADPDKIAPVADPRLLSDQQRIQQAQLLCERSTLTPGYDPEAVEHNLLSAMRIDGADQFYPGPEKRPPPPDPKLQLEQLKQQTRQQEMQFEKWQFINTLNETRRLNTAKIAQLEAWAAQLTSEATIAPDTHQLEIFRSAIDAFVAHNEVLTNRITAMTAQQEASNAAAEPATNGS